MLATDALVMALEVEGWMTRLLRPGALPPDETRRHHRPTLARGTPTKKLIQGNAVQLEYDLIVFPRRPNQSEPRGQPDK